MQLKRSPFIAIIITIIIVLSVGTLYLYMVNHTNLLKSSNKTFYLFRPKITATPTPVPLTASKLDGTMVTQELSDRHPLGVMIENHTEARPQFGLSTASFVYEAIAEGGITRYLAIYGPNDAPKVGPIRSARTYYVDWCNEYDCYYAHVGGNYDALKEKIPADKVKDLDQFANSGSYYRARRGSEATEHTMYSSTDKLYKLASLKTWFTPLRETYDIYSFFSAAPSPPVTATTFIKINFSFPQYDVRWDYNKTDNTYLRNLAAAPDVDANNNRQISAKNVIIQNISRSSVATAINENGWSMPTVGSGSATIYQGGVKIDGTWSKSSKYDRTQFFGADGKLITLYAGETWIEVVNPGSTVTSG
ncbi:MAG: DUF3048 domain-containing protein [Patescibacteria group bacterium]|jgi:hypothetical protein